MIIFLYGEDSYRAREKLKEIIAEYKKIHKSGLNLKYLDFSKKESEEASFANFKDGIRQISMFKEKKLAVITNPFLNISFKEMFLKEVKDFIKSDDLILLCQEDKVNGNDSLFKFLKKNVKCQEFNSLGGQKLKNWVKKEFEKYKAKIETPVLEKLIDYVGNDLWRLSNEIKKLVSYKGKPAFAKASAGQREIKTQDIELLVRSKIETDIFKTIDAIAQKNKKQALKLLHKHLEKGDSPLYLLSMINYQFRNLLIVKDLIQKQKPYNVILKKSGLHPFVFRKNYSQSQQFSFSELKKTYQKIFQVDLDIKTGRVEPEVGLDLLIAEI